MIIELNKDHISSLILFLGAGLYLFYVQAFEFIPSAIILLVTVLLWILVNVYFDSFNKATFSRLLCCIGVVFSISLFLFFGIEELPYPKGALKIHTSGIAMSLFSVLLSVIPMLLITQEDRPQKAYSSNDPVYIEENNYMNNISSSPSNHNTEDSYDEDAWEVANEEDFSEEGEYESPS